MDVALDRLIGGRRAMILRALDSPTNCGEIALSVDLGPSGATHHLRCLEAAGLINRRRVGRKVIVERTPLGHGLLALYERP